MKKKMLKKLDNWYFRIFRKSQLDWQEGYDTGFEVGYQVALAKVTAQQDEKYPGGFPDAVQLGYQYAAGIAKDLRAEAGEPAWSR